MPELRTCKGFKGRFHEDITYIAGPRAFDCPMCTVMGNLVDAETKIEELKADLDTERRGKERPATYRMAPEVHA